MEDNISELILSELRDLSTRFNDNAVSTGERLASLETSMYSLVGNGQPGRLSLIESSLKSLERWRANVKGRLAIIASFCGVAVTVVGWFVEKWLKP